MSSRTRVDSSWSTDLASRTPDLPSLTGLRWIAAASVFGYHLRNVNYFTGVPQQVLAAVFGAGYTGVSLFFVLSGFVLTWSARPGMRVSAFYRRRFARIVPLHLTALVLALILAATLVPGIRTSSPVAVLADAALVSSWLPEWRQAGNSVSWSLVCEAFFYACLPLLLRLIAPLGRDGLWRLLILVSIAAAAVAICTTRFPGYIDVSFSPIARLPEFVAGIALALLIRRGHLVGPPPLVAIGLVAVGSAAAYLVIPHGVAAIAFTLVGYLALVASLARRDAVGRPSVLSRPALVKLGELSFAFYLVHLLTLQAVKGAFGTNHGTLAAAGFAVLGFAVALGVAYALHRIVEVPARQWILGTRRAPRRGASPTRGTAAPLHE